MYVLVNNEFSRNYRWGKQNLLGGRGGGIALLGSMQINP